MSVKMPVVLACGASECVYNTDGRCRSRAINVGGPEPLCDTYAKGQAKGGIADSVAGVGACKVPGCVHNQALLCGVTAIRVHVTSKNAMCATFEAR